MHLNDTKHQHYQATALHMWKVCGKKPAFTFTDNYGLGLNLISFLPGGEEAF